MRMIAADVLAICLQLCSPPLPSAQTPSEINQLMAELSDEKTCFQAEARIRDISSLDSEARRMLAARVRDLIEHSKGQLRFTAVQLAEDLKIEEAVPQLVEMLRDPTTEGGVTSLGRHARLEDDPPGHALASIGSPAIPIVKPLLNVPDRQIRIRVLLVLANMNSCSAVAVLEGQALRQPDKDIRDFIVSTLARNRAVTNCK